MAFGAALPKGVELQEGEAAATFVVPAPGGCNLNCPFCVIRARCEAQEQKNILNEDDYVRFLTSLQTRIRLGLVSLVGHEPLLPESFLYTKKIIQIANQHQIPTAIITNGTYLEARIDELNDLKLAGLTVSLDSAEPEIHDSLRGTPGTYERVIKGIVAAMRSPLGQQLLVGSILHPGKVDNLSGMPDLLRSLGLNQWVVSPLFSYKDNEFAGPVASKEDIVNELLYLKELAYEKGVELIADDEFDRLLRKKEKIASLKGLQLRKLKRLEQVLRLSPTGAFSIGSDILLKVQSHTPIWNTDIEDSESFLDRCFYEQVENIRPFLRTI